LPHTKHQLKLLLDQANISPRRRWGQNFLIDLNLIRLLVKSANLQRRELVLEVGCGTGSLTELLAESADHVIAVDIDKTLLEIAREHLKDKTNVTLICGDVLAGKKALNPAILAAIEKFYRPPESEFLLIANLPYQIATPLIIDLLLGGTMPAGIFVTVQAEVALRMAAQPATKAYGMLSILLQAAGRVKIIRKIKPQAFWPTPRVSSAMVTWLRDENLVNQIQGLRHLQQLITILLGHRRKTIQSSLAQSHLKTELTPLLHQLDIDPFARGETLTPGQFVQLSNLAGRFLS